MNLPATLFLVTCLLSADGDGAQSAEATAEQIEFFEKQVRPILAARCYDCHSGDSAESGLRVDSLAGFLKGGTRGRALVPGEPKRSLFIGAVNHSGQLYMPPKEKLPQAEINVLTKWVELGAPWPGAVPVTEQRQAPGDGGPLFTEDEKNFWAFQSPQRPEPPRTANVDWIRNPIDAFVLAKLESAGLAPAPAADKLTLLRRASFDLTGLPPTPQEVHDFLADESDDAFPALIDRLLASPQYGVRWARHWLDVARYADSNGLDENLAYAHAYRYRDYVVRAFNADKPYDRFVQEQLAGDLLPAESVEQRIDNLTATGFLSIGAKMLAEDDPVKMQMDIVDEQVDTVGKAFLGLTFGCARCHDHKFDPLPTEDYYSLAGIFKSTHTMDNFNVVAKWHERPLGSDVEIGRERQQQQAIDDAQEQLDRLIATTNESLQNEARGHLAGYLLAAETERQRDQFLRTTKPVGADSQAAERDGVIVIEAEDFVGGNVAKDFESYGRGIGVILNNGTLPNEAQYEIAIDEPGWYQIELRYAAAEPRPCELRIDGFVADEDVASETTGSWNPETQNWFVENLHEFSIGNHKLLLSRDGPFPHIDRLVIAPVLEQHRGGLADLLADTSVDRTVLAPSFVRQWRRYLDKHQSSAASPFALWHTFVAGEPLPADSTEEGSLIGQLLAEPQPQTLPQLAGRYQQVFEQSDEESALRIALLSPDGPFAVPRDVEDLYDENATAHISEHQDQLEQLKNAKVTLPTAMAVADGTPEDIPIHIRGSHFTLGEVVPRRFPRILDGEDTAPLGSEQSGRLELARWMTSADQPLTSRVMANRLWLWHFGDGLVRSPDNFGRLGERPTHPALLDWLAVEFVRSGWSMKAMHRLIMQSSAYRMSTAYNADAAEQDPENRLLWRRNRQRLDAEAIRDAILAVAENLDQSMGGSLLPTENRAYVTSTANVNPVIYDTNRRSVYLPVVRSAVYEVFQAFDFADPVVSAGQRVSTTVAPQALFMMNSELVSTQTRLLAEQLLADPHADDAHRLTTLYLRTLARPPTHEQAENALAYIAEMDAALKSQDEDVLTSRLAAWQSLCRAIVASNEFLYIE